MSFITNLRFAYHEAQKGEVFDSFYQPAIANVEKMASALPNRDDPEFLEKAIEVTDYIELVPFMAMRGLAGEVSLFVANVMKGPS